MVLWVDKASPCHLKNSPHSSRHLHVPDGNEAEPSSDVDDDFDTDEGLAAREAEYERMAAAGTAADVPARRSGRAAAAAATNRPQRRMKRERGSVPRCPLMTDRKFPGRVLVRVFGALLRPRSGRSEF